MLYFFIAFGAFIIGGLIYTLIKQNKIKKEGIEAEGVVDVRVEESWDSDGTISHHKYYHVKYVTSNGEEVDATIGNPKGNLQNGDRIRIKYLPNNPKYAFFIEKL